MARVRLSEVPDALSPDHALCEHCRQQISWDEICYTHDASGFAECGVTLSGGHTLSGGLQYGRITIDPKVSAPNGAKNAEPCEWFTDAP